jgi:hypothetical protein
MRRSSHPSAQRSLKMAFAAFQKSAARAWCWAPEMEEIAAALRATGLPPALAEASATVLRHWTGDKDRFDLPLEDVLAHLQGPKT